MEWARVVHYTLPKYTPRAVIQANLNLKKYIISIQYA